MSLPVGLASAHEAQFGVREYTGLGSPGIEKAGDITHVKNLGGWSGSDIEFSSKEVVKLSNGATGEPVCKTFDTAGNCVEFEREVRDFAIAGALSQKARVIDITDPRNPVLVSDIDCAINQNDIQVRGDLVLVASDSAGGTCQRPNAPNLTGVSTGIIDFSDPRDPKAIGKITYARGSHNHTIHPTKPAVYLSDSDLAHTGLGNIPIYDISNPTAPVLKFEFKLGAHSPHDITFNADGSRAYVAAVSLTYILNTEDPFNPTLVSVIPNEGVSISHQSDPTPDGKYLLVADELGGGAAGLSPGGPVHVYDIRDETRPVKVGLIFDDCVGISATCAVEPTDTAGGVPPIATAHVFRINPDGYTMAIAWYKDGVHVIDYSDVRSTGVAGSGAATGVGTRTIGRMKMPNANTWAAKMWQERHPGYVFANDINRGLDVFYVESMGPGYLASGTITAANPAVFAAGAGATKSDFEQNCDYSPLLNGVDGWVTKIPAKYADGTFQLTAKASHSNPAALYDFDMYFYDANCGMTGSSEVTGDDETGRIPAGSVYALVSNFWPGNARVNFYVSPAPPEEE